MRPRRKTYRMGEENETANGVLRTGCDGRDQQGLCAGLRGDSFTLSSLSIRRTVHAGNGDGRGLTRRFHFYFNAALAYLNRYETVVSVSNSCAAWVSPTRIPRRVEFFH